MHTGADIQLAQKSHYIRMSTLSCNGLGCFAISLGLSRISPPTDEQLQCPYVAVFCCNVVVGK